MGLSNEVIIGLSITLHLENCVSLLQKLIILFIHPTYFLDLYNYIVYMEICLVFFLYLLYPYMLLSEINWTEIPSWGKPKLYRVDSIKEVLFLCERKPTHVVVFPFPFSS